MNKLANYSQNVYFLFVLVAVFYSCYLYIGYRSVGLPARPFLGCDWPVGNIAGMDLNLGPPDALLGALVLEHKYQPRLHLPQLSQVGFMV